MDDVFSRIATGHELRSTEACELHERGFVVLPGPMSAAKMGRVSSAYDAILASADTGDVHAGSTTTRVTDFVNRCAEFDTLYVFAPLLEACCRVIGRDFKLSSMHARTLRPHTPAQELHVDVRRASTDWPLVGFILMIDEFRTDNGATRFVPGTHHGSNVPEEVMTDRRANHDGQVLASGPAGSLIIFDGSTWHGHSANTSDEPRRSVQGAFIPRDGCAATDFSGRMQSETRARLGPLAQYVLALY
ncbi:MAG: phytanoyl-CoA dioxygenase family protein [Gemmatimonadaceae bacterium]